MLRLFLPVILMGQISSGSSIPSPTLRFKSKVSCSSWGPGCWIPSFVGTDSSPALVGTDILVIGSYKYDTLYGLSAEDGSTLWTVPGAGGEDSPKVLDTDVFAWGGLKGSDLVRINALTGERLWNWTPPKEAGEITTAGSVDAAAGLVFAGTANGASSTLFAVNVTDGATVWQYAAGGEMWGTLGPLSLKQGIVCVGVGGSANPLARPGGSLHCLEGSSGNIVWIANTGWQVQSRPAAGKESVFVGDYDHCLYALDLADGSQQWKTCTEGPVEGSPAVAQDDDGLEHVLVGSWDGHVYSFNGANGTVQWKTKLGPSYASGGGIASTPRLSRDGTVAYVGGPSALWALDVETGEPQWQLPTAGMVGSSPVLSADESIVYVGCEDGYLYAAETSLGSVQI